MLKKIKSFFFLDDEDQEFEQGDAPIKEKPSKQNVVSLQSNQKSSKLVITEPKSYQETQLIADELKSRRAVLVNLQKVDYEQGRRIVDFLSGTVYAVGGDIQRIGENIFLCTPDNVEVTGSISELEENFRQPPERW